MDLFCQLMFLYVTLSGWGVGAGGADGGLLQNIFSLGFSLQANTLGV